MEMCTDSIDFGSPHYTTKLEKVEGGIRATAVGMPQVKPIIASSEMNAINQMQAAVELYLQENYGQQSGGW